MSSSCAPSSDLPNEEASLTALAAVAARSLRSLATLQEENVLTCGDPHSSNWQALRSFSGAATRANNPPLDCAGERVPGGRPGMSEGRRRVVRWGGSPA